VFQLRGRSENWMPLSVTIVWIPYGTAFIQYSRSSRAVRLSALLTSRGGREFTHAVKDYERVERGFDILKIGIIYVQDADQVAP
jgi:hypothetical protein